VWVDTPSCTACDECTTINPKIFRYNGDKKIEIADPKGGPFKDIVKAAEKCTAGCIHPERPGTRARRGWTSSGGEVSLSEVRQGGERYQSSGLRTSSTSSLEAPG
jgi:ferredoxin